MVSDVGERALVALSSQADANAKCCMIASLYHGHNTRARAECKSPELLGFSVTLAHGLMHFGSTSQMFVGDLPPPPTTGYLSESLQCRRHRRKSKPTLSRHVNTAGPVDTTLYTVGDRAFTVAAARACPSCDCSWRVNTVCVLPAA